MKTKLWGDKKFFREVWILAVPVAIQNLLITSASMVDTIMLGSVGETAVAAVGMCAQFSTFLFAAFFGFAHGGTIFFSQFWGAQDEHGIRKAYGLTMSCTMIVGLLFASFAIFAPELIMGIYTDKPSVQQLGVPYLRIVGFSFPLQVLAFVMSSLLRSTERVKIPLYASIASLITNTFVNWLLIYGKFSLPRMGVRGAAVGTVVAAIVNVAVLYLYCIRDKNRFILRIREHYGWSKAFIKQYFAKSMFIVCNELFIGIANLVINIILGRQAESGLAALAVFRVIEGLVFSFFRGLTTASGVIVGKQIGAGEHTAGYRDAKRFVLLTPLITFCVCLLIVFLRAPLLRIFGLGADATTYGMGMLLFYLVAAPVRLCNWICNDNMRAGGDPVFGTIIEIVGIFCLTIPLMALAGLTWHWPFLAVFSLMYLDDFVRVGINIWYINTGRWIRPVTDEGKRTIAGFRLMMQEHGHKYPAKLL